MVKKENCVYIFIGQDIVSPDGSSRKASTLKSIKEKFLDKAAEDFNLNILYSKELSLKNLQERILSLPVNNQKRILIIKDAQDLKEEIKDFILKYVKNPHHSIILILDMVILPPKDSFVRGIVEYAQVFRFKEEARLDAFILCRAIESHKADYSLNVLRQLLDMGERPEMIMSALRYAWEKDIVGPLEKKRKLKLLLACDIDIKTGRVNPRFALERLIISLCAFTKQAA